MSRRKTRTPFEVWTTRIVRLLIVGLIIYLLIWLNRTIPSQNLPWKELDPDKPIGVATRAQLLRVSLSPSTTCMDMASSTTALSSLTAEPKDGKGKCGWDVARLVYGVDQIALAGESTMQCPLSLGVRIWLDHTDQLAQDYLGQPLAKIHHYGTYSCRRLYGRSTGPLSEHAFANAWDVAGFELADGTHISVLRDWDGSGDKSRFLKASRDAACNVFRVTLSPDYNQAHADHFHLDMGPNSTCR